VKRGSHAVKIHEYRECPLKVNETAASAAACLRFFIPDTRDRISAPHDLICFLRSALHRWAGPSVRALQHYGARGRAGASEQFPFVGAFRGGSTWIFLLGPPAVPFELPCKRGRPIDAGFLRNFEVIITWMIWVLYNHLPHAYADHQAMCSPFSEGRNVRNRHRSFGTVLFKKVFLIFMPSFKKILKA
jgi:hypothetical protein